MNAESWIQWSTDHLAETSLKLSIQGYSHHRIDSLNHTNPIFRAEFDRFQSRVDAAITDMTVNPDGYHHYDVMINASTDLLEFTNLHRAQFLGLNRDLAA